MTNRESSISEVDIHAYVDGLLKENRAREVADYLKTNPDMARQAQDWKAQNAALRAAFDPIANAPVPGHLLPDSGRQQTWSQSRWAAIAASLLLLFSGAGAGWLARGVLSGHGQLAQMTSDQSVRNIADSAISAHAVYAVEVRHPVEVPASQQKHLVKWLSKRLGRKLTAPDLSAMGYSLIGGRLLPSGKGPAAQFMYEDVSGRRITVYAIRNSDDHLASFRYVREKGYSAFYWLDKGLSYAIVGDASRDELGRLAKIVHHELSGI